MVQNFRADLDQVLYLKTKTIELLWIALYVESTVDIIKKYIFH